MAQSLLWAIVIWALLFFYLLALPLPCPPHHSRFADRTPLLEPCDQNRICKAPATTMPGAAATMRHSLLLGLRSATRAVMHACLILPSVWHPPIRRSRPPPRSRPGQIGNQTPSDVLLTTGWLLCMWVGRHQQRPLWLCCSDNNRALMPSSQPLG